MKKLFNGKFLVILASCLICLIILTVGAFYLFDDTDNTFIKSGYVLNPMSETSEKYFFNKNTGYHKNLSSMIEFSDVDEKDVSVLEDSFIHYSDESISFLKNGAILDLDSIHGTDAVKFYNIPSNVVIEKDDSGYVIKSKNGEIKLDNFIGRISDNKYIVCGDLQLKLNGNNKTISGDYFEIVYIEEGIVNIENKDTKYQVTAEDTSIMIGNDKSIDLGTKSIAVKDENIMSLTAITIDGNENIEIVPEVTVEDKKGGGGSGDGDGSGDGTGTGTGKDGGEGTGGTGKSGTDSVKTEEIVISLKEALIGSTNIDVTFDVINNKEDDNFSLQVVNLNSGRTVDVVASVIKDTKIYVNLLSPNTKYLFTVVDDKNGNKYFQKIFETNDFVIKLEKSYATSDSIAYKVYIDEDTDITDAKLSLYKYNEETKQNEVVNVSYTDSETNETKYVPRVTYISNLENNNNGVYEIVYDGLDSDTIYTAVLDEFSVASTNFKDVYNLTVTAMTLKRVPSFGIPDAEINNGEGSFILSLGEVTDPDNAITKYTYNIYNKFDNSLAISPISKNNASPLTVKIGDGEDMLSNDVNYFYRVVIEYFDNEKYVEYVISDSITFMMGNDPYITVEANTDEISYDRIAGTIYLTDNSCLVTNPGRTKCDGVSTSVLVISKINPLTGELVTIENGTKLIDFEVNEGEIKYDFSLDGLEEGTSYHIDVKTILNNDLNGERTTILHSDTSSRQITTKTLSSFFVSWDDVNYTSDSKHVVNVGAKFNVDTDNNTGTLSPEDSMSSIKKIVLELYQGSHVEDISYQIPMATKTFNSSELNFKTAFYDMIYDITSDGTFGYSIDNLKNNNDGKLSEYYTVVINAYYDRDGTNKVKLSNNIYPYQINRFLLLDNIDEPTMEVEEITNKASGKIFSNLTNEGTIVGYKLSAAFDREGLIVNRLEPQSINFYVYDKDKNKVKFYVLDSGNLKLVDHYSAELGDNNFYEQKIYMGYGTDYSTVDDIMSRGNEYYVGYEITVLADEEMDVFPSVGPGDSANYQKIDTMKETPYLRMHIAKSTANSIKYEYEIDDPDSSVYSDNGKYKFYYSVNDGEVNSVELISIEGDYPKYKGDFTISNLNKNDIYNMYYLKNVSKKGLYESDVLPYLETEDDGYRLFEGYYNALELDEDGNSLYNYKFEIINNQLVDNKVTIKMLADEVILDRIVSYKIAFVDSKGNRLDKELWQLSKCNEDDDVARCLSVDYVELKNAGMKSNQEEVNNITVSISALYDNGLSGYEYKVGNGLDYEYMIFQNNNTKDKLGSYVSFASNGNVSVWSDKLNISKGYYTYTLNNNIISYKSKLKTSNSGMISFSKSSTGYLSTYGILNPKMISTSQMSCDNNKFSFSSITPKVTSSVKSRMIDGAYVSLNLSGVDINDLVNEGTNENPKYYLYLLTWYSDKYFGDTLEYRMARPMVKVEIDSNNLNDTYYGIINGVLQSSTYYYGVYANMYKDNKPCLTQLFDATITDKYETKMYSFNTLQPSEVFNNVDLSYTNSDDEDSEYSDKKLNLKFNLTPYTNSIPYDFDLVYVFCESGSQICNAKDGENIYYKVIPSEEINKGLTFTDDISDYDLEFDKSYYLMVYARVNYYNNNGSESSKMVYDIDLNRFSFVVKLKKLSIPEFTASREAVVTDDGEYALDFKITVNDLNHTISNGKYKIKLLDEDGNIVGKMQLVDEDGQYYDVNNYKDYEFDALVNNKNVRITNLESNKMYSLYIYADAYVNNYIEEDKDLSLEEKRTKRTKEYSKSYTVYTVNDYGVAFGNSLLLSATEKSIVVTFLGGSNFSNVTKVRYSIGLWDGVSTSATTTGTYDLVENTDKKFEISNTGDWRFIIDPSDMRNELNQTYTVNLSFEVKTKDDEYVWITSADNSTFENTVQYVKDK